MQTLVSVGATKTMTENERLETPRQLAERVGISERKVRALIKTGRLEYVMIGARPHIPAGAFARFVARSAEEHMGRRNEGPSFCIGGTKRGWSIRWTEGGRDRERSTGTRDRQQAQIALGDFLPKRDHRAGPRDPSQVFVTDVLNGYREHRGQKVAAPDRIAYAVLALADFWEGNSVADVTPQTCGRYVEKRGRSAGTVRRELGVLRAAINYAHKHREDYAPGGCRTARPPRTARPLADARGRPPG